MKNSNKISCNYCYIALLVLMLVVFTDLAKAQYSCKPRPMLVETTNNENTLDPSFVPVHRCQGGIRPGEYQCQPDSQTMLKVRAKDFGGEVYYLEISNHTSCREVCVCGRCLGSMGEPFCEAPTMWNPSTCKCGNVFCPSIRYNVKDKGPKDNLDAKVTYNGISYTTVALLMVAELIAISISVVIFQKWRENRTNKKRAANTSQCSRINYQSIYET